MKKILTTILKTFLVLAVLAVIGFDVLVYNVCEKQKKTIDDMGRQQMDLALDTNNRFKYQQEKMEKIGQDMEEVRRQVSDQKGVLGAQKDALLQEVQKRQQMETSNKNVQTALYDIKAEGDALKDQMKAWQKDYVAVLAQLEKKMDDSRGEIKALEDNLTALDIPGLKTNINSLKADIERMAQTTDNSTTPTPSVDAQTTNSQSVSP